MLDHSPMPYAADPDLKRRGNVALSAERLDDFAQCGMEGSAAIQ